MPPLKEHMTDWEVEHWSQLGRVHAWRTARRVWSDHHGDALGTFLERLQFERETRRAYCSELRTRVS